MKEIKFTCGKEWSSMKSVKSNISLCQDCNKLVKDYTKNTKSDFNLKTDCGVFHLGQVSSFKRSFNISSPQLMQLSLMTLLGLSMISSDGVAQSQDVNSIVNEKKQNGQLKVSGQLINSQTKKPLQSGIVELYNSKQMIAVVITDHQGRFSLSIDTIVNEINNLRIVFNRDSQYSDTTMLSNTNFENMIVELDVKTFQLNNSEYSITGDVTEVEEQIIDCKVLKDK